METIELSVGRWGNSFAARIPAETARALKIDEGAKLRLSLKKGGGLVLREVVPARDARQAQEDAATRKRVADVLAMIRTWHATTPVSDDSLALWRGTARY